MDNAVFNVEPEFKKFQVLQFAFTFNMTPSYPVLIVFLLAVKRPARTEFIMAMGNDAHRYMRIQVHLMHLTKMAFLLLQY
jgi:hypothetical protein